MKNHYPLRVTVPFYYALQLKSSAAEYICNGAFLSSECITNKLFQSTIMLQHNGYLIITNKLRSLNFPV